MPVDAPLYPVGLVVAGRRVLVVGGGSVAADKVRNLMACGADVHVVAASVSDDVRTIAGVTIEERAYRDGEAGEGGYRLVIAATDDPAVNRRVRDDADAAGVWVNAADDPANCTFTLPAVVRRGPVIVAVATGGHSPALAAWLRDRLAADIGPEYEVLAELLAEARARGPRDDWRNILDSGILDDIKAGRIAHARERLRTQ